MTAGNTRRQHKTEVGVQSSSNVETEHRAVVAAPGCTYAFLGDIYPKIIEGHKTLKVDTMYVIIEASKYVFKNESQPDAVPL